MKQQYVEKVKSMTGEQFMDTLNAAKTLNGETALLMARGADRIFTLDDVAFSPRDEWGAFNPDDTLGWKRCPKPWSHYFVNADGQVMGQMGEVVKTYINNSGYECLIGVNDSGKHSTVGVHRLVALTFLPNPQHLSDVDHLNSDRLDNNLSNLRFLSHADNLRGREKTFQGRPVSCHEVKTGKLVGQFGSINKASKSTGVSGQTIAGICNGSYKSGQAKGYTFDYLD